MGELSLDEAYKMAKRIETIYVSKQFFEGIDLVERYIHRRWHDGEHGTMVRKAFLFRNAHAVLTTKCCCVFEKFHL